MNGYTCIIIDDEHHAIGLLSESLKGLFDNIEIIGTFSSWKDGLAGMRSHKADILFLDIAIDGKNGMHLLEIVPGIECEVIFVTAYAEHALDAFKYAAAGYILKPIGDAELSKAVSSAMERIKNKRLARMHATTSALPVNSRIGIPSGKGVNYYNVDDIIYLEAINNYTRVVTKNGDVVSSYNIGKFKTLLERSSFFHVHRSYIVNLNYVGRYEAQGQVIMTTKIAIPVARNSKEEFLKVFSRLQSVKE